MAPPQEAKFAVLWTASDSCLTQLIASWEAFPLTFGSNLQYRRNSSKILPPQSCVFHICWPHTHSGNEPKGQEATLLVPKEWFTHHPSKPPVQNHRKLDSPHFETGACAERNEKTLGTSGARRP